MSITRTTVFAALILASTAAMAAQGVRTPDIRGVNLLQAKWRLQHEGLTIHVEAARLDKSHEEGDVLKQIPPPGTLLTPGQAVNVVVSRGPHPCNVPNLSNLSVDEARRRLSKVGLDLTAPKVSGNTLIVQQWPAAGTRVESGAVAIAVAPAVAVPALVGQPVTKANTQLVASRLKPSIEYVHSSEPHGTVLGQSPMDGMEVAAGQPVTLTVAR